MHSSCKEKKKRQLILPARREKYKEEKEEKNTERERERERERGSRHVDWYYVHKVKYYLRMCMRAHAGLDGSQQLETGDFSYPFERSVSPLV